jgi:galactose-1-phosphate uridylyltransferase
MEKPRQVNPNTAPPHEFLRYVDELETYVNKLEEQLRLYSVSNQRELLIAFLRKQRELHYITIYENDFEFADKLLKAINCC